MTQRARVRLPDDQVRIVTVHREPKVGELLETDDLPGQWLASTVESSADADRAGAAYDVTVESAEGSSA